MRYLLLGGGSAASSAAEAIRLRDAEGEVMLVSAEAARPYRRPPLARGYLRKEMRQEDLFVHPASWYAQQRVMLRTHVRALSLDPHKRCVTLSDNSEVFFDRLLIATGATARRPGIPGDAMPGAMYLRTLEDADRIHHAADVALTMGRGRVCVIGGLVAAEIAASLAARKPVAGKSLAVTLVCSRAHVLEGLAGENAGRAVMRELEALGVTVLVGSPAVALEGDGRVQRVVLPGGINVPCDFAVVSEGWSPSKDLLRGTNLVAEKAILTDARGMTNVPGVYAAGECAAMFDPVFKKHRVLDHWDVAVSRGKVAGTNMTGSDEPWEGVTRHHAEVGKLEVAIIGEPRFADWRIVRDMGEGGLAEIAVDREGRVCAVVSVGWHGDARELEGLVRARFAVGGLEDSLRDPTARLPIVRVPPIS